MKLAGWFLLALAAVIAIFALQLDTDAATYVASGAGDGTMQATRAPSLALLQRQMMLFQLGLAAFVGGVLLHVGSELAARPGATPRSGEEGEAQGASSRALQRRPAGRGELIAGGIMVGVIVLILLVVAMSGRGGGDTAAVNTALPPELMNDADGTLVDEEPRPARVERNAAAPEPKVDEPAPAGDAPAAAASPAGNSAQPASPPPTSNSAGGSQGNGF